MTVLELIGQEIKTEALTYLISDVRKINGEVVVVAEPVGQSCPAMRSTFRLADVVELLEGQAGQRKVIETLEVQ